MSIHKWSDSVKEIGMKQRVVHMVWHNLQRVKTLKTLLMVEIIQGTQGVESLHLRCVLAYIPAFKLASIRNRLVFKFQHLAINTNHDAFHLNSSYDCNKTKCVRKTYVSRTNLSSKWSFKGSAEWKVWTWWIEQIKRIRQRQSLTCKLMAWTGINHR